MDIVPSGRHRLQHIQIQVIRVWEEYQRSVAARLKYTTLGKREIVQRYRASRAE